ncbi:PBP superfamily domain-containing protein [Collimonas sp. OK607]|uniref:substrate-binding domain-containing protein n=1 Tax=Collimonas sp. OK607 TaxID=1798194 RepID=UPI0008E61C14|nr:substrate-binding domain-containing protein [Collimonas sp. OK607]SFA96545.1 PBP superfamily domain-containing protein [Collimonas sp. OK607]
MKNSFSKMFWMVAASFFLVNPAFSESVVTGNVMGAPYMHGLYMALADDFSSIEKPLSLKYSDRKTDEFAKSVSSGAADFSVSDVALTGKELEERKLIQFPSMVTAIVPVVNLPGVESNKLILNGVVLAKIMTGEIVVWNDESIRAKEQKAMSSEGTVPLG